MISRYLGAEPVCLVALGNFVVPRPFRDGPLGPPRAASRCDCKSAGQVARIFGHVRGSPTTDSVIEFNWLRRVFEVLLGALGFLGHWVFDSGVPPGFRTDQPAIWVLRL